jgi:hypothetical protein
MKSSGVAGCGRERPMHERPTPPLATTPQSVRPHLRGVIYLDAKEQLHGLRFFVLLRLNVTCADGAAKGTVQASDGRAPLPSPDRT